MESTRTDVTASITAPQTTQNPPTARLKICLLVNGTRGDVYPHLALAIAFMRSGYHVRLITHHEFQELAAAYGITDFCGLDGSPASFMKSGVGRQLLIDGEYSQFRKRSQTTLRPFFEKNHIQTLEYCTGVDAIIYGNGTLATAYTVGEYLSIPVFGLHTIPTWPTSEFLPPLLGMRKFYFGLMNSIAHSIVDSTSWKSDSGGNWNKFRSQLNLKPLSSLREIRSAQPIQFYCVSPNVVPRPQDWPSHLYITGYLSLPPPPNWEPPSDLVQFLESGPPPIYIGFGNAPVITKDFFVNIVYKLTKIITERIVFCIGWSQIGISADRIKKKLSSRLYMAESIPHEWLLPRCCAAVHHGGAGTSAAALRAGIPQVIYPLMEDQYFWAIKMGEMGVAPADYISFTEVTLPRIIADLCNTRDPTIRLRAETLANNIRAEGDTAGKVVDLFRNAYTKRKAQIVELMKTRSPISGSVPIEICEQNYYTRP